MDRSAVDSTQNRRSVIRAVGALAAGGLAGCLGGGGGGGTGGDGTGSGSGDGGDLDVDVSEAESYASASSNYDGPVDRRERDSVTVAVGASGNNGNFAFDPPLIVVSPGTTVVWEWTGEGSTHNVVAEDGAFDSGSPVAGADTTFEHSFPEAGTFNYYCFPHKGLNMVGSVVVA